MTEDKSLYELASCDDQLAAIIGQLYDASLSPRFQVLVTQGFVEVLINAVIDAKCKNAKKITSNSRDFPYSIKLLLLHELELIDDRLYRILNELRKHRNKAAHDPFYEVNSVLQRDGDRVERLHEFCIAVICDFFNRHKEILAPIVAPTITSCGGGVMVFPTDYRV